MERDRLALLGSGQPVDVAYLYFSMLELGKPYDLFALSVPLRGWDLRKEMKQPQQNENKEAGVMQTRL